jgi:beta-mannosidase
MANRCGPRCAPATLRCDLTAATFRCAGELELAWVYLEPSWTFARTIAPGALGATPGRVLLRSEGIDTIATVTLNGRVVGQTTNMFHRPVWDVTFAFRPAAENTLEVRIDVHRYRVYHRSRHPIL